MLGICTAPRVRDLIRPSRWPPRPPSWGAWLWVLLSVLAVEMFLLPLRRPRAVSHPETSGAVLITTDWGEKPIRRLMPPPGKGDPNWERGPCSPPYKEISGYCWAAMDPADFKPPCPGGLYEDKGRCFAPVVKANPNRSLGK